MKKWLIALTFCLAICVCACFAMADEIHAYWDVRLDAENPPTHAPVYISVTVDGADSIRLFICDENGHNIDMIREQEGSTCIANWATDTGGNYTLKAVADFDGTEYTFVYSESINIMTGGPLPAPVVTISDDFAVDGGGYAIDSGDEIRFSFAENEAIFDQSGEQRLPEYAGIWYNAYLYRVNDLGELVRVDRLEVLTAGREYSFRTDELIGGAQYCISVDAQECGYNGVATDVQFRVNSNQSFSLRGDEPRVTVDPDTGIISAPMHQWIPFRVTAPGAGRIRAYCLDAPLGEGEDLPEGIEPFEDSWTNGSWDTDFQWVTNTLPKDGDNYVAEDYTKYFYAQVDYDEDVSILIKGPQLNVSVIPTTMHTVNFEVDNGTMADGRYEVARDGRLFVNVDNYYQDENDNRVYTTADYYGIYIGADKNDDSTWVADSHWVKVPAQSEGIETTRVPLTVPRCEPGDYTAHVFAIKFGEPQLDLDNEIPITVTGYNGCPFILSMGSKFVSGDPLRVYAHYTDPENLDGWMTVRIVNTEDPYDVIFEDTQGYKDFWNDTSACWHEGTFRVEADIWCWSPEDENHIHERYPNNDYPEPWIITVTADDVHKDDITVHEPRILKTNEEDPTGDPVEQTLTTTDIKAGEDLKLKILKPDYADFYEVQVWYYHPEWGFENFLFEGYELTEDEIIININKNDIPDANPMDSTEIYISVHGFGRNKNDKGKGWGYPVMPETTEGEVFLAIDGLEANNTVPVNKDIGLTVTDTSADPDETRQIQMVGVFSNNGFTGYHGPDGDGIYRDAISFEDEGQYPVFALVTFDEVPEDFEWWRDGDQVTWYATNTVEVTATSIGQVGEFSFTLDDSIDVQNGCATVERGKLINVTYTPADHATNYWIDIDRYEEEWDFWGWIDHVADLHADDPADPNAVLTAVIPTARLEAGKYRIRAVANGEGYLRRETEDLELNLTEPESSGVIFNVDVPADENGDRSIVTCEDYLLSVYAPGAEWVDVIYDCKEYNFDRDEGWRDDWRGRDSVSDRRSYSNSGTYTLVARGWYPAFDDDGEPIYETDEDGNYYYDEEGNPYQVYRPVESNRITVTVTANGGSVTVKKPSGLPDYITIGTQASLSFTVTRPVNAEAYSIDVWYDDPNGGLFGTYDIDDASRTVTIPAAKIPRFQTRMHVKVRGWGYNLEADEKTWDIPVIPAAASNVTLNLDGLGQDNRILVNRNAVLTVEKAKNETREMKTICVFNGRNEWNHEDPDEDGTYRRDISFDDEGTYTVYAKVTFDTVPDNFDWDNNEDPREWFYTNPVVVTAEKVGNVGPFSFSIEGMQNGCVTAERGQMVTVTYTPATYATHYWIDVEQYDERWHEWQWIDHAADLYVENPEDENAVWTAMLPTAEFDADHRYRIRAVADAEGYVRSETASLELAVSEPEESGIFFTVDVPVDGSGDRNLVTGQDYTLSVYAPGADWVDVIYDYTHFDLSRNEGWKDDWWGRNSASDRRSYSNSGTYTLVARGWYPAFDENNNPVYEIDDDENVIYNDEGEPVQVYYPIESDRITLTVTATGESVVVTRPEDLPAYIPLGTADDLEFTVKKPVNADQYQIEVWYDDPYTRLYERNNLNETSSEVTISAGRLPPAEKQLRVKVRGWGYNKDADEKIWNIPVVPATSDKVSLTMTGLGDGDTLPVNTDATLRVEKAVDEDREIQTVYIYDGYGNRDHDEPDGDGAYERRISFGDEGTFAVYAMVTFDEWDGDGDDNREWVCTNVVTVNVTKIGDLGPFSYELNKNNVTRGELITVTYTPEDETGFDVHYWVDIGRYNEYGEWYYLSNEAHVNSTNGGTATILTAWMEAGTYYLRARSNAPGYVGRESEDDIVITVTEPENNGIIFNVDVPLDSNRHGTVHTSEDIRMSAYAPGASFIEVLFDYDHFNFEDHEGWRDDRDGDFFRIGHQYGNTGEYKMVARAWCPAYDEATGNPIWEKDEQGNILMDDEGNNIPEYHWIESDPIVLNVIATGGSVTVAKPEGLPAYIMAGTNEDLTFTVEQPENAEYYEINVWCDGPDGVQYADNDIEDESRTVTIPSGELPHEENLIRVRVRGWGYNVESAEETWIIPVVPTASNKVTLTMTGLGEENTLPVNTDATLRVEKTQNEERSIQTVCIFGGYDHWGHEGPDEDGAYEHGISFGEARTFTVYAMVTFDQWNGEGEDTRTWYATNVITINVTKAGDLRPFSYELDSTEVTRGDMITVTYTPETETDFDVHYWVDIGRYYGNSDWRCEWNEAHVNSTNGGTATIPTARLEEGTYYIRVKSNAPGYVGWEPDEDIEITVTEPENDEIIFNVDVPVDASGHRTIHTSEDIQMSAYARGAGWIEVIFDYDSFNKDDHTGWWNEWNGDSFTAGHQYGNSGEYKMVARAWCPAYDEVTGEPICETDEQGNSFHIYHWVESDPIALNVIATGGSVEILKPAGLPDYITARTDEDLAFTVNKPENAEYYEINVWYDNCPDGGLYGENNIKDPDRTVSIAADELPQEENRIYVKVRGWGFDVESGEETWSIPVVPAASDKVTLTMTGLEDGNTLPVNTNAKLRVEKTEGTEGEIQTVSVFGGYDHWGSEGPNDDGAYERDISFGDARPFIVYAVVTFYDPNENTYTEICTNVVTVDVTKTGDLGPFSYTLNKTDVTRGDMITVTYTPDDETGFDVHYWLDIGMHDDYGNWHGQGGWDEAHLESMDGGTAVFRTEWMGEGTYYIRARSNAPGFVGFEPENETAVTITEPEAGSILFAVDVPETDGVRSLTTCEEFQLSIYAPGAERVDVIYDRDSYDFERDEGWKQDWGGDRASGNSRYDKTGTYTLIARGWYPVYNDSGEPISETDEYGNPFWVYDTVESAPIELTVTATGGSVTVAKPTDLPDFITAGAEDLEFTVTKPQNAEGYSIDVWCDGQNYNLYSDGSITDESRTVTVDRYMLPWTDTWVNVRVCGYGYNLEGDDQTWRIPVIRADNHVATLTLEGLGESNTIPVNKDAKLTITKNPDEWGEIQTVCVFGGYGFRDHDGVDGDGVYRSNISFGDEETFVVYALVTFDPWDGEGEDTRTWYATNAVVVNVTTRGQANPFTIGLSSAQVNRGEKIRVTINTPEGEGVDPDYNSDHYGFNLRDMDDPDWRWITPNSIAEINTTNLRPGTYQICAYGNAEGLTRYETPWETITVNNPEMGNERIRFRVNGGTADVTAQIAENLEVSVIAPGAIRVGFFEDGNPWHEENGRYCWADSCDSWYISDLYWMFGNDVGTHELKAAALFDEDEGWVQSDPIHVTITKTGDLAFDLENVPPYFTENAAESFTIDLPDHADWMRIRAYRARETGDNGQPWRAALLFDEPELFDDYTVSIAGSSLIAGEQIWIEMEAFGLGYASDQEERHIPVLPEAAATGATLMCENVQPDGNGMVNVLLNQDLEIALVPDEGETLAAVRFFDGRGYWENYSGEEINRWNHSDWFRTGEGEDGAFCVHCSYDGERDVGLHTVFAYYRLEGEDNMSMAGPIVVNVSALGTVGAYDFVPNQETTVTVTRGEMVTFEFTAAQNAEYYWLDAFSGEGDDWHSWDPDRTSNGTKVTLFTAELPTGEYEIWGRAGRNGWIWTESDSCVRLIVTEQDADWVSMIIKDEVLTNENVHWSAFAPDAVAIDVKGYVLNGNNDKEYFFEAGNQDWIDTTYINGECCIVGHAGTVYVDVTVWYADSDPRTYTTPITVSAPNGNLTAPRYSSTPWYAGQDLNITITPDQNTEWYTIDDALDGYGNRWYHTPEGRTEAGAKTLNVSWNQIGDGYISITIHQHGVGYNDSLTTVYIRPIDTTGLITLPAALSTIEEGAFEDNGAITHVIIPDGVTFIGDRAFCNCSRLLTVEIQSRDISFGTNAFDAGITIYGYSGSTAESYAQANGISFVGID